MAINARKDGKWEVTCRDEADASRYAVLDTKALAEGFFIRHARAVSRKPIPAMSFGGLCEWYFLHQSSNAVKSAKRDLQQLHLHAVPLFGDVPIGKVHLGHLNKMRAAMIKKGLANSTANYCFKLVRTLFHCAHVEGVIENNGVSPEINRPLGRLVAKRHATKGKRRPIKTPPEKGYELLRDNAPPHIRVALDLMADWVRFSEIRVIELDCVDLARRLVLIKRTHTVHGIKDYPQPQWRYLPLSERSVASIRRLRLEVLLGPMDISPGREDLLIPHKFIENRIPALARVHGIAGDFSPENIFNRTVINAVEDGKTAFEIAKFSGRASPTAITQRFHVAFRRRTSKLLVGPMNANLDRLLGFSA